MTQNTTTTGTQEALAWLRNQLHFERVLAELRGAKTTAVEKRKPVSCAA